MKEVVVNSKNQGQRFDKYLSSLLPGASFSFLQKMIRKKNIVLNDKKAKGNEILNENDIIKIYFSDETFEKFSENKNKEEEYYYFKKIDNKKVKVVYENENVLVLDKPFGVLSQKSSDKDISLNEMAVSYLIENGLSIDDFIEYKPAVVNRLDRNTGGLIICAKNKNTAISLSKDIKDKKIRKIYNCIVHGNIDIDRVVSGYYIKDEKSNTAFLSAEKKSDIVIETRIKALLSNDSTTLLEAELYTGKSHQIRISCAYLGHPILNDKKYGDRSLDKDVLKGKKNILPGQYLYASKIIFKDGHEVFGGLPSEFTEIGKNYDDLVI